MYSWRIALGYNYGFFHFLAKFLFTTDQVELDYYHEKLNPRVASRVAERLKALGNYGSLRKSLKLLELIRSTQSATQKSNFDAFCLKFAKI